MLVLFDNWKNSGRRVFYTHINTYNETVPSVNLKVHNGIMQHICPTGAVCILFIDDASHNTFFEYFEVQSSSQPDLYAVGLHLGA
jgi:hypothetical protein